MAASHQTAPSAGSVLNWRLASSTMVRASSWTRASRSSLVFALRKPGRANWAAVEPQAAAARLTSLALAALRSGVSTGLPLQLTRKNLQTTWDQRGLKITGPRTRIVRVQGPCRGALGSVRPRLP